MVRRTGGSWSGNVHVQRNTALRVVALISLGCARVVAQVSAADDIGRLANALATTADPEQRDALFAAAHERFFDGLTRDTEFASAYAAHERWSTDFRPHAAPQFVYEHETLWAHWLHFVELHDDARHVFHELSESAGLTPAQIVEARKSAALEAIDSEDHADAVARCDAIGDELLDLLDPAEASVTRVQLAMYRANAFVAQGLTDRALQEIERAHAECICEEDFAYRVDVKLVSCNVYLATEQFERIDQLLDEALLAKLRDEAPATYGAALVRLGTARSELARSNRTAGDDAREALERAFEFLGDDPRERLHAQLILADLESRRGEPRRALELLASLAGDPLLDLEQRVRAAALRVSALLDMEVAADELERDVEDLEQRLYEFIAAWRAKPIRKGGVGFLHWGSQRLAFSSWIRAQLRLDGSRAGVERALSPVLAAHELASTARELSATSTSARLRAEVVAPGRGVLIFMPGPERCHVFCIDELDTTVHELRDRDTLRAASRKLEREWTTRPTTDADELARRKRRLEIAAREAHEAFLPAKVLARIATWREVIVVGADLAGEPSFEVFALEPGRWLGLEKAFVYSNSTALALALDTRARECESSFERDVTLIGAPLAAPRAGGSANKRSVIVLSEQDVDGLLAGFDPKACDVRLRERATVASLREPSVGNSGVLTVFAHGVFEPGACEGDERSAIVLMTPGDLDDGVLCCSTLEGMDLPPFVELLSCGAARGPLRFGDGGASHLVGASFIGGARAVLASRFEIGVDASLALMRPLHTALRRDGASPMVALLEARQTLASDPATADPWYWASLTLHGAAWRPIFAPASLAPSRSNDESSSSSGWKLATIAALALAAAATWMRRRPR